jgi:hypothetical protein
MSAIVKITIYRWAGKLGPFRITGECAECDFALAQARGALTSHPDWPVEIEVKPWLNHFWEALSCGGWHAPIVAVNGEMVSQGEIPDYGALERAVQRALAPSASRQLGFWARFRRSLPPPPS